jgi:predicted ABC-type ATPase
LPNLYIIAGPNGAGKTTASLTVLPEMLNCRQFVNADEIAKGLSPFEPETVALQAGRLMLERVELLLEQQTDFAIETTLSTRSYINLVSEAKMKGYQVTLLFFQLSSAQIAKERVLKRVSEGGHDIPPDVIERRFMRGIANLKLFIPIVNRWYVYNNEAIPAVLIAKGGLEEQTEINNFALWQKINQ